MFDELSGLYDRYNAVRDRLAPATATWLAEHLPGGARAVDLGCGPGRFTPLIAARYDTVLAVDLSEQMIQRARHQRPRPNITYQQRSLLDVTPQQDGTWDAVVTVNTVHHAGALDAVLPHLRRLVAPGGSLLLVDIVNPGRWGDRQWHIEQAFAAARHFYHTGGEDAHAAADVLRLLAHPRWLDMTVTDIPPTRGDYRRHAEQVFPAARYTEDLHPMGIQTAFTWTAPAA
jgi:2-polyprenyl-3-methyl-5-hydroxy-6-metoxy-1,4-benzoquinol methylase